MAQPLWRVQLAANGDHVSCTQVADGGSDDACVHYVHASDELEAYKEAARRQSSINQRLRSSERIAAGKCPRCGVGEYDGSTRCATCKERDTTGSAKRRLEAAVERFGPTLSGLPPGPTRKERHEPLNRDQQIRLEILREVSLKWQASSNQALFCKWLASEILKLDPAAQQRRAG